MIPPIYLTSTFAHGNPEGFDYTRSGNPNFRNLQAVLASLENAKHATVFASGVSAITAVASTLKSGDCVIAEENIYGCTFRLFKQVFEKFGVTTEYYDLSNPEYFAQIREKKPALTWIESPTNPLLKILDIAAIADVCREAGSPLVVDNTFATSYTQRPLDLGATLSLSSTTKYINGHSDSLGGVVCTNSESWAEKMTFGQKALGLQPSPMDCWLIARGVKTLSVRMQQHQKNALSFAMYLEGSPMAKWVRYPFLHSHPHYDIAKRQMSGGSGIVTAEMDLSFDETMKCVKSLQTFTLAESLGAIESLVCHPASMTHASIPEPQRLKVGITNALIRFSVGIEDIDDLIADVEQAYHKAKA